MLHRFPQCPGITPLKEFLIAKFDNYNEEITFNQLQHTGQSKNELRKVYRASCNKIDKLSTHWFIAKSQTKSPQRL